MKWVAPSIHQRPAEYVLVANTLAPHGGGARRSPGNAGALGRWQDRDCVDGDEEATWQVDVGGRGPCRRRLWHVTGINSVDRGEVVDVLVKDRGLDQGREGRPGGGQDRVEVTEGLFRLCLDAFRDRARG